MVTCVMYTSHIVIMFLDVFDLVLANILPNIEQIFKG